MHANGHCDSIQAGFEKSALIASIRLFPRRSKDSIRKKGVWGSNNDIIINPILKGNSRCNQTPSGRAIRIVGGDRVQDMLIEDLIQIFQQYSRYLWNLEVGQTLWFAVHMDEKPGPGKTLSKMRVVSTVLSITHEEDKQMRINGYSHQEIERYRVARMLKEAYAQKGVLTQADVAELIGVSAGTIGKDIKSYQSEQGIILPYRRTIHDIGPSLTHKKVIIEKFLQGISTPNISRMTQHTEEACDRYVKAFKKVRMLHGKMKPLEIARIIGMSERPVNEYIALIDAQRSIKEVETHVSWTDFWSKRHMASFRNRLLVILFMKRCP
jgi:hypothetical protein